MFTKFIDEKIPCQNYWIRLYLLRILFFFLYVYRLSYNITYMSSLYRLLSSFIALYISNVLNKLYVISLEYIVSFD